MQSRGRKTAAIPPKQCNNLLIEGRVHAGCRQDLGQLCSRMYYHIINGTGRQEKWMVSVYKAWAGAAAAGWAGSGGAGAGGRHSDSHMPDLSLAHDLLAARWQKHASASRSAASAQRMTYLVIPAQKKRSACPSQQDALPRNLTQPTISKPATQPTTSKPATPPSPPTPDVQPPSPSPPPAVSRRCRELGQPSGCRYHAIHQQLAGAKCE